MVGSKVRAGAAMVMWLALMGCDDDDPDHPKLHKGQEISHVEWHTGGCDNQITSGEVVDQSGNRGKVTVTWKYLPGAVAALLVLSFVTTVARRPT